MLRNHVAAGFAGSLENHKHNRDRPEVGDKKSKVDQAREMKEQAISYRKIAQRLEVSVGTVGGWLSEPVSRRCELDAAFREGDLV